MERYTHRKQTSTPINDRMKQFRKSLHEETKDNENSYVGNSGQAFPVSSNAKKRKKRKKKNVQIVEQVTLETIPRNVTKRKRDETDTLPCAVTKNGSTSKNCKPPTSAHAVIRDRVEKSDLRKLKNGANVDAHEKVVCALNKSGEFKQPVRSIQRPAVFNAQSTDVRRPTTKNECVQPQSSSTALKTFKIPKKVTATESTQANLKNDLADMEIDTDPCFYPQSENLQPEEMEWKPQKWENIILEVNEARKDGLALTTVNVDTTDLPKTSDAETWAELSEDAHWFLVVDTNVFISALPFIKEIIRKKIPGRGYPVVYVPVPVIRELDCLKARKDFRNPEVAMLARNAIRFLNTCFSVYHPRIKGQTWSNFLETRTEENDGPDDQILISCLQLRNAQEKNLVLLSNDVNLRNKALIEKLETFSVEDFKLNLEEADAASLLTKAKKVNNISIPIVTEKGVVTHEVVFKKLLDNCHYKVQSELDNLRSHLVTGNRNAQFLDRINYAIDALSQLLVAFRDFYILSASCDSSSPATRLLASSLAIITCGNSDSYIPTLLGIVSSEVSMSLLKEAEDFFSNFLVEFQKIKMDYENIL